MAPTDLADVRERLARIETALEAQNVAIAAVQTALAALVPRAVCDSRHPPKTPVVDAMAKWLQLALLIAAIIVGGLKLGDLELRVAQSAATPPKVIVVTPAQLGQDAGARR